MGIGGLPTRAGARTWCRALALISLIAVGCGGKDDWGTPEYFERIVGVRFTPAAPVVSCSDDSGPAVLAFRLVQLPADAADPLRNPGAALQGFPHQLSSERERKLQPWARGAMSDEARDAFQLAVSGATTAIEHSRCRTMKSEQVAQQVRASLAKDTTWYSYAFKSANGRVQCGELEFRVLDPIDRVLYELVC